MTLNKVNTRHLGGGSTIHQPMVRSVLAAGSRLPSDALDLLERRENVGVQCDPEFVEVTENDVGRIPLHNLRVPIEAFVAVWTVAEQLATTQAERHEIDWYTGGVVVTCQWIARAIVRPTVGPWRLARSPISRTTTAAYEELLEAEYLAAEVLDIRRPDLLEHRPGWCEGIRATLRWAWRHSGPPPIDVPTGRERTVEGTSQVIAQGLR